MSEEKIINNLYQKSICVNAGGKGCYSPYSDEKEWSDDIDVLLEMYQNSQNQLQQKENIIKEVREYIDKYSRYCSNKEYFSTRNPISDLKIILDKEVN